MKLQLPHHTVLTLVGPSMCGKSTIAEQFREQHPGKVAVVSSDEIRRTLCLADLDRHDQTMMYASDEAFQVLWRMLYAHTSWPTDAALVVVDTTGLSDQFRERVRKVATDQGYETAALVFDFKSDEDHLKAAETELQVSIANRHASKLKRQMGDLTSEAWTAGYHKVTSFGEPVELAFTDDPSAHYMDEAFVVGDVHGELGMLIELLHKAGYELEGEGADAVITSGPMPVVLIGDAVDKGSDSVGVIRFIDRNTSVHLIAGNHDLWVYNYLRGKYKNVQDHVHLFDSVGAFEADDEVRDAFYRVVEAAHPFVRTPHGIATHVPCRRRYLGKLTRWAVKEQSKQRYPRRSDFETESEYEAAFTEHFKPVMDEGVYSHPKHLFGHVEQAHVVFHKNKVGLDTGAASGGRLSGAFLDSPGKLHIVSVGSKADKAYEPCPRLVPRREGPTWNDLEPKEKGRVRWAANQGTQFVSGTMSPAASSEDNLEHAAEALAYYKAKGQTQVMLQPKHMGSRANVYLTRDDETTRTVSRQAYPVWDRLSEEQQAQMKAEYARLRAQLFAEFPEAQMLVLDCELMPWNALGKGLIEHVFKPKLELARADADFLASTGFHAELTRLITSEGFQAFKADWGTLGKKKLQKKHGQRNYHRYVSLMEAKIPILGDAEDGLARFEDQLEVHGQDAPIELRPFCVLKVVYEDREEVLADRSPVWHWKTLVGEPTVVDVDDLAAVEAFMDKQRQAGLEGLVMKPLERKPGTAPFIKCRTADYLTIVYGPDYLGSNKLPALIASKSVDYKRRISVEEWEIGLQMLGIPTSEISEDNADYRNLWARMIGAEKRERELDPRL